MSIVTAVFEKGVFRPTSPVNFPEGTRVLVETVMDVPPGTDPATILREQAALDQIYSVLAEVHPSGHTDTAAKHDEHAA